MKQFDEIDYLAFIFGIGQDQFALTRGERGSCVITGFTGTGETGRFRLHVEGTDSRHRLTDERARRQ